MFQKSDKEFSMWEMEVLIVQGHKEGFGCPAIYTSIVTGYVCSFSVFPPPNKLVSDGCTCYS